MNGLVHIPLDFERLETSRLFVLKLTTVVGIDKPLAVLAAYRIWADWFLCGKEWRPLKAVCADVSGHPWNDEELTFILSESTGITPAGKLMSEGIESGFLILSPDGKQLSLAHFWRHNEHCSPDYLTIQQRGAKARHAKQKELAEAAEAISRHTILKSQGTLDFGVNNTTEDEEQKAVMLIAKIDRACGQPVRKIEEYKHGALLADALKAVRTYDAEKTERVITNIINNRLNPAVVKITERVLENFHRYLNI